MYSATKTDMCPSGIQSKTTVSVMVDNTYGVEYNLERHEWVFKVELPLTVPPRPGPRKRSLPLRSDRPGRLAGRLGRKRKGKQRKRSAAKEGGLALFSLPPVRTKMGQQW